MIGNSDVVVRGGGGDRGGSDATHSGVVGSIGNNTPEIISTTIQKSLGFNCGRNRWIRRVCHKTEKDSQLQHHSPSIWHRNCSNSTNAQRASNYCDLISRPVTRDACKRMDTSG